MCMTHKETYTAALLVSESVSAINPQIRSALRRLPPEMGEATVVSTDPPLETIEHDLYAPIPPLDCEFLSQQLIDHGGGPDKVSIEDLDLDFSFVDLWFPSAEDLDDFLNPTTQLEFDSNPATGSDINQSPPILDQRHAVFESNSQDLMHASGDGDSSGDRSSNGSRVLNSSSPELESLQISGYMNVSCPESNEFNRDVSGNRSGDEKVMNSLSPESPGSGDCGSNGSEDFNNFVNRSVISSPDSNISSVRTGAVNHKIELKEQSKYKVSSSFLKRKSDSDDFLRNSVQSRINKCKKSNCNPEKNSNNFNNIGLSDEDEKRKVRLMRNRESAQLSRQRKKQYVEELEDKVKKMHSTIQDLNAKISYFMTENATLRQQMGGADGGFVPPPVAPPAPGMYPYPMMHYPWMPCAPPYMMKPQGSQVPLVPIPRLKPQQPAQASKTSKKSTSKKNDKKKERPKTKKVAGISFIGLLFFIILFGGLAPLVNVRFGGIRESLTGGERYIESGFYGKHHRTILMVNGTTRYNRSYGCKNNVQCGQTGDGSEGKLSDDEFVRLDNGSEPLVASLYVPRNDKLVKIDGNLIIHSVLASEKALSSRGEGGGTGTGTSLAVPGDFVTDIPVRGVGMNVAMHSRLRALASGSLDEDNRKAKAADGRLQQWFREGLSGPMLSSGMCTEVLQFDASSAIVPSPVIRNISEGENKNSTHMSKRVNRRILGGLPIALPDSSHNMTRQHAERNPQKDLTGNTSAPPMVVSILVDPREAADADVDGRVMGGTKSISRIFVVVLIDSVKYITYSCMLPFKGAVQHLVTA